MKQTMAHISQKISLYFTGLQFLYFPQHIAATHCDLYQFIFFTIFQLMKVTFKYSEVRLLTATKQKQMCVLVCH